jgi:probable metal-binding protein
MRAMNLIHGHQVLQMMLDSGKSFTRQTLTEQILKQFGPQARFNTCSAENLTAAELVSFLESKGKFVPSEGGFTTSADLMCKG